VKLKGEEALNLGIWRGEGQNVRNHPVGGWTKKIFDSVCKRVHA